MITNNPYFFNVSLLLLISIVMLIALLVVVFTAPKYAYVPIIIWVILIVVVTYRIISTYSSDQSMHPKVSTTDTKDISRSNNIKKSKPSVDPTKIIDLDQIMSSYHDDGDDNDIPSYADPSEFAKWLYSPTDTCKENPSKCKIHEDVRFHKN